MEHHLGWGVALDVAKRDHDPLPIGQPDERVGTCTRISPADICCSSDGHDAGKSRQCPAYGSPGPRNLLGSTVGPVSSRMGIRRSPAGVGVLVEILIGAIHTDSASLLNYSASLLN
jgi:hypothetical protein